MPKKTKEKDNKNKYDLPGTSLQSQKDFPMAHGPSSKRQAGESASEEELPPPPDGGWGWVVVFASFMIHIVADGFTYSFGIFHVEFLEVFNEGNAKTAWIASILVGVTLGSGPISSAFVTRYGCRNVTMAGALLGGICLVVSIFAQNVFTLLITIGLGTGLGFGMIYLPAIVSVTIYFEKYRSLATGIAVCGSGFGTFLFAPLTECLVQEYGWRGAMLLMGGIVFHCIFFGALFRPLESPKDTASSEAPPVSKKKFPIPRSNSVGHSMEKGKTETMRLAQSQPSLGSLASRRSTTSAFQRKDIFYQGSLMKLGERQSKQAIPEAMKLIDKQGTLVRENLRKSSVIGKPVLKPEKRRRLCPDVDLETLKEMMDYTLFTDPVFIIFLISNFATSIGFNAPYVYIASQAKIIGLSGDQGSYLLSVIGIANTLGRIVLGYLSDKTWVNRLLVYNICLTISGIATALVTYLCYDFISMAIYGSIFGFTIGAYVGLTSVILVDLLGLDKLTNAFGLLLLFQGVASLIGPPLVGFIYDITKSYQYGFVVAGLSMALSGAILFIIPPLQNMVDRRKNKLQNLDIVNQL